MMDGWIDSGSIYLWWHHSPPIRTTTGHWLLTQRARAGLPVLLPLKQPCYLSAQQTLYQGRITQLEELGAGGVQLAQGCSRYTAVRAETPACWLSCPRRPSDGVIGERGSISVTGTHLSATFTHTHTSGSQTQMLPAYLLPEKYLRTLLKGLERSQIKSITFPGQTGLLFSQSQHWGHKHRCQCDRANRIGTFSAFYEKPCISKNK